MEISGTAQLSLTPPTEWSHVLVGGGGGSSTSRYPPLIRIYDYFTRGGYDMRRYSTYAPEFSVRSFQPVRRINHTFWPISQMRHWSLWECCRTVTRVSASHNVSLDIHAFCRLHWLFLVGIEICISLDWCQWWNQSSCTIGPVWVHHLLFLNPTPPLTYLFP